MGARTGKYKYGARAGKYKSGRLTNANWGPGPVNTNWGPEPGTRAGSQGQDQKPSKGSGPGNANTFLFSIDFF